MRRGPCKSGLARYASRCNSSVGAASTSAARCQISSSALMRSPMSRIALLLQLGVDAAQFCERRRHLVAQHLRHNGLEQKIHRAELVAAGQVPFVPISGEKENGRLRISSPISKPSMSGILTLGRTTGKSPSRRHRRASVPQTRQDEFCTQIKKSRRRVQLLRSADRSICMLAPNT